MRILKKAGLLVTGLLGMTALLVFAFYQTGTVSAAPGQRALTAASAQTTNSAPSLAGTNWLLQSLDGDLPLQDTFVTMQFGDDGALTGSDGCNQFNTTYTQEGTSLTIDEGGAAMTMIACQADVMAQATAFMDALAATTTFASNRRLLALQNGNQILATFVVDSQDLEATSWDVTAYNNGREAVVSPILGSEITVDFGADGLLSGNAGCNDYFSTFVSSDGTITIDPPASTFRTCDLPPGVMEQEGEFLLALASASTYDVQGNQLQMRTADDQLALMLTRRQVIDLDVPELMPVAPWGRVTAPNGLNVRSGPGVNFPVIAVALNGDEGEIIGQSADGRWWVVSVPSTPTGMGWVSADFVIAVNAADVPVIQSPPPPVIVPPTSVPVASPTPVPAATATPSAQISFSADQTNINQGDCTTLRWQATNVQVIWVNPQNELFDRTPQPSQGSQVVCPAVTTTYEMRVQLRDGSFDQRSVTVNVAASQQPQISFWADRTTINQGECTRLHWSVENVQGVWVYPQGQPYARYPRVGNDSELVCPTSTTTYEMRVLQRDNSTVFRIVTITVNQPTPVPQPATPTPVANPLADTNWNIISYNTGNQSVTTLLPDTHANVNFGSGGQLNGNASCNNFTGSYSVNGNSISVGQAASQSMMCGEPEGIMQQESQILAALQSATTFRISGNQLEMRTGGDQIALILTR